MERHQCLQEEAEVEEDLNRPLVAEEQLAVELQLVAGSIDSKQHNFDNHHRQHTDPRQVDWRSIEHKQHRSLPEYALVLQQVPHHLLQVLELPG